MKKIYAILMFAALSIALALQGVLYTPVRAEAYAAQYDPAAQGIVSGYLCVDRAGGYIHGVAPETTIGMLNTLSLPGDMTASTEVLGTGTVLTSAAAAQSLTVIMTGDLNGDGAVTITDMLMVKSHILGTELSELAAMAGDINYDGSVSISDFLSIKSNLLGLNRISFRTSDAREPLIILAPGQSQAWDVAGVSYRSDAASLVQIGNDGVITAGENEGTTFVYALGESGEVLARTAVTVLEGGLTVSLDKDTYALCPGQTLDICTVPNHPVAVSVSWTIENSEICSVSESGVLTGNAFGSTLVRATLPNGSYAEATVRVMPPITELDFEKHLYKLKPDTTRQLDLILTPDDTGEEIIWASSDSSIATVSNDGLVSGVEYGTVTITATGKYSGLVASCTVKVCDVKQVAITFDDGPSKYTPQLLDWLAEHEVKATFFLVVNRVPSFKSTVKRIVNEGHELGYHSYAHKFQIYLDTDKIISDYEKSCNMVRELTGQSFTVWRAPGGNISERVLDAIPLPHIMWALDTRDWENRNTQHVYNMITKYADDGEIILLHDLYKTSVNGAIKAMEEMLEGDYEFLTVTELLSRDGTPPKAHATYKKAPK